MPQDETSERMQKLNDNLEQMRRMGELLEANQAELSKMLFARYQSLIKAGFTEVQALEIIKSRGIA